MTFETYEESVQDGLPVTLFYFKWGDQAANYYAYTDLDQPITFGGITYNPTTIGRESIEQSGGLDNKTLEIQITPNAEIVEFFKTRTPAQQVALTIYGGHYDDVTQDYKTIWLGRLLGVERKGRFATLHCEPIITSLRRPGLRRRYQYGCPWVLYSTACGASQAAATRTSTVSAFGTGYIDVPGGWQGASAKASFNGGYLNWADPTTGATQALTIIGVTENGGGAGIDRLTVNGSTYGLAVSTALNIYLGCAHTRTDCLNLHNNINNFGGQSYIPQDNPVGFVNRYY